MVIDLRSDTVTRPSQPMLEAMMKAEVGDDVFGEDPTVNALENNVARLFGMEGGLFVPSGTMGNQLSIKVLTRPGDEILIDHMGHIFNYETSATAFISSVQPRILKGRHGKISAELLTDKVRGEYLWEPRTRVLVLENSTNRGGGSCYTVEELSALRAFADEHKLKIHLDGARIWNAVTATDIDPTFFGTVADTIMVCFSKGLGAPAGSMILSSAKRIRRARRYRKMLGGGMRQVGILAGAADFAIEHHWPLLEEDHRRTKELAGTIDSCRSLFVDLEAVETNILIFDLLDESPASALERLKAEGILMVPFGPKSIRAVFHHQVGDGDLEKTKEAMKKLFD